jgi:hypothetical protein
MQDNPSSWPTSPSLVVAHLVREHTAHGLWRGWCACRNRDPWDPAESKAWQEGYLLRLRVDWHGAVTLRPVPPPVTTAEQVLTTCVRQLQDVLADMQRSP